jgi:hypothetical protein
LLSSATGVARRAATRARASAQNAGNPENVTQV